MKYRLWPWAVARWRNWSLAVAAHSRGATGISGHYSFERGLGARFTGAISVPSMKSQDALQFRAFLHSLRGRSGSFETAIPSASPGVDPCASARGGHTHFTDCTGFTDGTTFGDPWLGSVMAGVVTPAIVSGADVLTFSAPHSVAAGSWLTAGGQLFRVTDVVSTTSVRVRPRTRNTIPDQSAYKAGAVEAFFRLGTDTPVVPLVPGYSRETQVPVEELT